MDGISSIRGKDWMFNALWAACGDVQAPRFQVPIPFTALFRDGRPFRSLTCDKGCVRRILLEGTYCLVSISITSLGLIFVEWCKRDDSRKSAWWARLQRWTVQGVQSIAASADGFSYVLQLRQRANTIRRTFSLHGKFVIIQVEIVLGGLIFRDVKCSLQGFLQWRRQRGY